VSKTAKFGLDFRSQSPLTRTQRFGKAAGQSADDMTVLNT